MNNITFPSLQTTRDLRRANQQTLLRLIYFNEPISRLELSERSGLSPATVTNLVANLIEEKVVRSVGTEESQGGRPRTSLAINPQYGYFVGVEVAETHIYTALYTMKLNKIDDVHIDVSADDNNPEVIAAYIVKSVKGLQSRHAVPDQKVISMGVGMPGIVNRTGGVSIFAPNWGWHNIPFLDLLHQQLNISIQLDNGMQALALAEAWFGVGQHVNNLAELLLGTGVAAGIIIDGLLYRGTTNSAGEWGHTCVDLDGPDCRCGSRGCIESFIGAPGILRQLREVNPQHPALGLHDQQAMLRKLCDSAEAGDPDAVAVMNQVTRYLGVGIANIINLFNPQLIVIGGWCGVMISPYVVSRLQNIVQHYALGEPLKIVDIKVTRFGGEGGIGLGAACLALESFLVGQLP